MKKKSSGPWLIPLALFALSVTPRPVLAEHKIATSSLDESAQVGQGYDPIAQRFVGSCLNTDGRVRYSGATSGSIVMQRVTSSQSLEQSLGFSVNSKARFGIVTAKLAASFLSQSTSNSYSDSVTFENAVGLKQVNLLLTDQPKVFLTAASLADLTQSGWRRKSTLPSLTERFQASCGDEYVRSVTRGAKLFITVKIDFASSYDKQELGAELNIQGGFNELSAKIHSASEKLKKSASISVSAFQIGGDPTQLGQLFSPEVDAHQESSAIHAVLRCNLSDAAACTQFLDGVISYATSNQKGSFRAQLPTDYDPTRSGQGAADLEYITAPWSDAHLVPINKILNDDLRRLRTELSGIFESQYAVNGRVVELLSGKFRYSAQRKRRLEEAQLRLNANFDEIAAAARRCYSDTGNASRDDCSKAMTGLREFVASHEVDKSILDVNGDPAACGPHCKLCVENKCLKCTYAVSDFSAGPLEYERNQGPKLACEKMPEGALVSVSAAGSYGPRGYNADRQHGDWWIILYLSHTDASSPGGSKSVSKSLNNIYDAFHADALYSVGTVPADGKVEASVGAGLCQTWPANPCNLVLSTDMTLTIEAKEHQ